MTKRYTQALDSDMDIRSELYLMYQRIRILVVLGGAGAIQFAATLLGFALGIAKPQWLALPVGVFLWTLAFWYAFVYARRKPNGMTE